MRSSWKVALIALLALFAVSCAGAGGSPPTPAPPTPAREARSQPKSGTPAPNQEPLILGSPDSLISSPEPDKAVNILFILDASGSMLEPLGGKAKVEIAKEVVASLVQELPPTLNLGLRVYGHRYPEADKARSCQDVQLLTPLGQGNARAFAERLGGIRAMGWTPMAGSLELAGQDMAAQGQSINNVVLLSDGQETCGGQPIEVAQRLKEGPIGLTVHTIGFAINEETRKELQEMARVSGGTYNEAQDAQGLLQAVERALVAARSGTFLRGEVVGEGGRRVAASLWLQDPQTGRKLHELRTWIDSPVAPGLYDLLVGTAPRVLYPMVTIQAHTRTIIRLSTGALRVELADAQGQPVKVPAHLKDRATGAILRTFSTWYNQPVLPGTYDLAIEANPTVVRRDIQVSPGRLTVADLGWGSLRLEVIGLGGGRPNWETELRDPNTDQVLYRSIVGREQAIIAGAYNLVVLARPPIRLPVTMSPGEAKVLRVETGLLRVELLDNSGQRVRVQASLADASQREMGSFSTWEEVFPLPGAYTLTVYTQPQARLQVQVSASEPTILRLRSP